MISKILAGLSCLVLLGGLTSCQSAQESATSAQMTCSAQGLKPGTSRYEKCVGATYQSNRQQSQQAENAAVAGAAVGVIGGAVLGASLDRHHHYYRRCGPWGCYY
ncbi:hypothetical protein [Rhizobium halophytocola]|uniref:Glycine zipper domain-containing protein n=1 Tax=Rhizobium halophytocola TaxID=735519 RepID=A0ABS4DV04_9HYPH|nr:hypothetical protein [Rhizobium halophytocola]MBP1849528.1 hypothetical protein [Rhizobium halophytocola]